MMTPLSQAFRFIHTFSYSINSTKGSIPSF